MVDKIARRYGVLPHEVLDLSPGALGLAAACVAIANEDKAITLERMNSGKGIVFPVAVVGE